jgi:hypothetical protein
LQSMLRHLGQSLRGVLQQNVTPSFALTLKGCPTCTKSFLTKERPFSSCKHDLEKDLEPILIT